MTIQTRNAPGTFCWPELYTTDQDAVRKFYGALFGWSAKDIPMGPDNVYTIFTKDGSDAAACYGRVPDMEARGIPSHWMSYVSVTSADEAVARVRANGGAVLRDPFDVPGIGRMASLQDPGGAAFCVWQAKPHIGIGVVNEPNALMWTELMTRDRGRCEAFYRGVFDWGIRPMPTAGGSTYHLFTRGETPVGGMLTMTPDMDDVRTCWCVYFQVENTDAAVGRALELGAAISVPAQDAAGMVRFACLIDPTGGHFGVMQPLGTD